MILQSRRWRLLLRTITLVITSILMLAFAASASYALQDDTPLIVTTASQLFNKEQPINDAYVFTRAIPDLTHVANTNNLVTEYKWIVLPGYNDQLVVRTEGNSFIHAYYRSMDLNMYDAPVPGNFYGKATPLKSQPDANDVVKELAQEGITIDKENTMVLLQGEEPSTYRPMVPVVGILALCWIIALIGLFRILSGRTQRRRPARR